MTISSSTRKAGPFTGNGTATTFPFTFKVFQASDLLVVRLNTSTFVESTLVLNTDYTVALNQNQNTNPGGSIVLGAVLATGFTLTATSDIQNLQPTDLTNQGGFYPTVINDALDRATIQIQQIQEEVDRSLKYPISDPVSGAVLPSVGARSTTVLAFDENGEPVAGPSIASVGTVAGNIASINAVADDIANIDIAAENVTDINNFADVYQGAKTTDPTLRNNGSALRAGDMYFNTTVNEIRAYSGTVWVAGTAGTMAVQRFDGTGSATAFTLATAPAGENNTQVYINGVYQQKDSYAVSGVTLTFDSAPPAGTGNIEVVTISTLALGATDSSLVTFLPSGAGAAQRTAQSKMRESPSVVDQGADPTGGSNSSAAFARARAITNRYFIPPGTYVLNASPDPFLDCFTSANGVTLVVNGVSYDCSNAFAGPLRFVAASAVKTNIVHAKTGNVIQYWQDGSPGTATGFYRGLAFTTDSHWVQAQPATNGGSVDMLMQRSTANADPGGNRFNATFEEALDRWNYSYATTASGAPNFDSFLLIYAGTSPSLAFPGLPLLMNQGWKLQTRAGGALKLSYAPTSATVATLQDDTSGNVLQTTTRSYQRIAGTYHNTLLDTPSYKESPSRWGGSFGDLMPDAFPVNKTLFTLTGATRYTVIGTLRVACVASGGGAGQYRETRFVHDGTTLTLTDVVNTITNFTATIAMSGSNIQFQGAYGGGLGGGYNVSVSVEWCHVGR